MSPGSHGTTAHPKDLLSSWPVAHWVGLAHQQPEAMKAELLVLTRPRSHPVSLADWDGHTACCLHQPSCLGSYCVLYGVALVRLYLKNAISHSGIKTNMLVFKNITSEKHISTDECVCNKRLLYGVWHFFIFPVHCRDTAKNDLMSQHLLSKWHDTRVHGYVCGTQK